MAGSPTFAPLSNPTFRALWFATLVSNLGGLIQTVGAGWMMTELTTSPALIALVQASNSLPMMAFSLIAGALADNFDRRLIMIVAQVLMLVLSALLALAAWGGLMTPWLLLAFTFLIGAGNALFNPSWQASVGDIVPRDQVPEAVSLNSMGFNMMRSVGPAIGGAIVAAAGAAAAFAVNTVSYLSLIGALWVWKPTVPERVLPREDLFGALGAGFRYAAMSPALRRLTGRGFVFGLGASVVLALLPLYASAELKGTAIIYGVLLGAFGFGAILAVMLNAPLRARMPNEWIVRCAFAGFAIASAGLGLVTHLGAAVLFLLVAGASWVLALSLFNVSVQLASPRWVVGRALAMYQTAVFGGMTGGAWLWGTIADLHGSRPAFLLAAVFLIAGAALGVLQPLAQFVEADLDPLGPFRAPELRLDLRARSGPMMIMVDYEIAQEDVAAFLAVMRDRRRVRIRDGARQWVLLRDLENPHVWSEAYHVATWVEYVRHNERRTKADSELSLRLKALHRGDWPPRVHRMIERQTVPVDDDMPLKRLPEVGQV